MSPGPSLVQSSCSYFICHNANRCTSSPLTETPKEASPSSPLIMIIFWASLSSVYQLQIHPHPFCLLQPLPCPSSCRTRGTARSVLIRLHRVATIKSTGIIIIFALSASQVALSLPPCSAIPFLPPCFFLPREGILTTPSPPTTTASSKAASASYTMRTPSGPTLNRRREMIFTLLQPQRHNIKLI